VAALVGAYEAIYTSAPSQFLTTSPEAATTILLAVALGYLATFVVHGWMADDEAAPVAQRERGRHNRSDEPAKQTTGELSNLDDLMTGEKK
jgi:hypothetical protein